MNDDQIKYMVERFLSWKLPADFNPDAGIRFEPEYNVEWNAKRGDPPNRHEPVGTNLFDYTQAEVMVRHMVEGVDLTALLSDSRDFAAGESPTLCDAWNDGFSEAIKTAAKLCEEMPTSGDETFRPYRQKVGQGLAERIRSLVPTPVAPREEQVERVARACCDDPDGRISARADEAPCYDDSDAIVRTYWKMIARAAIEAMNQEGSDV